MEINIKIENFIVPGKEDYNKTIKAFCVQFELTGEPEEEWKRIFNEKIQRNNLLAERNGAVINSILRIPIKPEDDVQSLVDDLKEILNLTNSEYNHNLKMKQTEEENFRKEVELKLNNLLKKLEEINI